MTQKEKFAFVGIQPRESVKGSRVKTKKDVPVVSVFLLGVILLGCLLAELIITKDPTYLDLQNFNVAPNREFLFGTDTLGRDIFSCIWYGGRVSVFVGLFATLISTLIAVVYGAASGLAPDKADALLMRFTEIFLSVPGLLIILFALGIMENANALTISLVIGITSWCPIAKIVRTEVRQIRTLEYVLAAKCMGGGFFHILWKHLIPNFMPSIMFMVVMNIRTAIAIESTLSFMGMGLPLEIISWGSMLSLAEKALLTGSWWMILIPGVFLVTLLMCMTNIGAWLRKTGNQKESYL